MKRRPYGGKGEKEIDSLIVKEMESTKGWGSLVGGITPRRARTYVRPDAAMPAGDGGAATRERDGAQSAEEVGWRGSAEHGAMEKIGERAGVWI